MCSAKRGSDTRKGVTISLLLHFFGDSSLPHHYVHYISLLLSYYCCSRSITLFLLACCTIESVESHMVLPTVAYDLSGEENLEEKKKKVML